MRLFLLAFVPALLLAIPGEAAEDPLAALTATGTAEISFTPGVPLLTEASRARLEPLIEKARDPACYWVARGRNKSEAETLRAALAEHDIAIETIAVDVKPMAGFAQALLYCAPPPVVTTYFLPGRSDLTEEMRQVLTLVAASHWGSGAALVVRGYADAKENADPLKLGLDRAQAARSYLIALGLAPTRLTLEANTRATGRDALRVEITLRPA